MEVIGIRWEYFMLYLAISFMVGYILDILITTQGKKMPRFFKLGKINIFGTLLLPLITVIAIYTKKQIPPEYLDMVASAIYFGGAALFVYYAFKAKEHRQARDFNMSVVLAIVFLVLAFISK
jgi:hypothetical protein